MSLSKSPELILVAKKTSRELRRDQTKAEEIFWEAVRGHRFMGLKFYRQHPLFFDFQGKETFFIADFYCHKHRIVIEIDGRIHDFIASGMRREPELLMLWVFRSFDFAMKKSKETSKSL